MNPAGITKRISNGSLFFVSVRSAWALTKTQSKMIGVTATMRKLLLLVYSLWKSREVYDPTRDKTTCSKKKKEAETSEGQPHGIDVGTLAEE